MAAVNVTTFAEFLEAVQVSGDTVNCPQNAVWDLNEIAPDGIANYTISYCAKITGNGTTIRNARLANGLILFAGTSEMNGLHVVNTVCESGGFFGASSNITVKGCKFSGIIPPGGYTTYFMDGTSNTYFESCSFALESSTGGRLFITPNYGSNGSLKYCRVKAQLPNAGSGYSGFWQSNCTWCKIDIDAPGADTLMVQGACANVYGGDLPLVANYIGNHSGSYISLINSDEIPNLAAVAGYTAAVTTEQLHDAAYLANLGFPIGVEA